MPPIYAETAGRANLCCGLRRKFPASAARNRGKKQEGSARNAAGEAFLYSHRRYSALLR
jgi:hypothetical protein